MPEATDTPRQPPHPVLTRYYADAQARQTRVNAMFDAAAGHYDRIEGAMSLGTGQRYRRESLSRAGLVEGMRVLDVGCGTGLMAKQAMRLVGPRGRVIAIDPSTGMLTRAEARSMQLVVRGVGEALPFADNSFDFLSMGYALRHVPDLGRAFREFRRVLKSAGVALILEITAPASRSAYALLKVYLKYMVPAAVHLSQRGGETSALMSYYWATIDQCVPPTTIVESLRGAGFASVERRVEVGILSAFTARA